MDGPCFATRIWWISLDLSFAVAAKLCFLFQGNEIDFLSWKLFNCASLRGQVSVILKYYTYVHFSVSLHKERGSSEAGVTSLDFFDCKVKEVSLGRSSIQLATATLMDVMIVHKHNRSSK